MKMKIVINFLFIGLTFQMFSQAYTFDNSFGENGYISYTDTSDNFLNPETAPVDMFYLNDKYVLVQSYQLARFNSDGSRDLTFGINGKARIAYRNYNFAISSAKLTTESIYVCGQVSMGDLNNTKGFIAKFNLDGSFDTLFGDGGIAIFEVFPDGTIGDYSSFNDLLINTDGSILITGWLQANVIVCKLTSSGTIDLDYSSTGYKSFGQGRGKCLIGHHGGFLLVSTLGTTKIDNLGNIDVSFGINGIIATGDNATSKVVALENTLFYIHSFYVGRQGFGGHNIYFITGYDADTFQVTFPGINANTYPGISVLNDTVLVTDATDSFANDYGFYFRIRRFSADGAADLSFNNTGVYIYAFPSGPNSSYATVSYPHDDGKIFIAGWQNQYQNGIRNRGLGMFKIQPAALGLEERIKNDWTIYPNPTTDKIYISNFENWDAFRVYDVTGKEFNCSIDTRGCISVSNLKNGIYFLSSYKNGIKNTLKFIKK